MTPAQKLINEFGRLDPRGGCWEFITLHHASLWRRHIAALLRGDLLAAAETYRECLELWMNRKGYAPLISGG